MLMSAVIFITLALVFYTIGVFSEKFQGILKKWHLIIFWLGLVCDTLGTSFMSRISNESIQMNLHGITGLIAIIVMLFHAIWATVVLIKNDQKSKESFHKFSIIVWIIWIIPYISGMIIGMSK